MKILYGVNSNGFGHINRSSIFINELMKDGHDVHVLFAGKPPPEYAINITPKTLFREGLKDIYKKHKIDYFRTSLNFLVKWPKLIKTKNEVLNIAKKEQFDVFFTDIEQYVSFAAKKVKKPCFNIDHISSLFLPTNEKLPSNIFDQSLFKFLYKFIKTHYTQCYTIDFTDKIEKYGNVFRYPLIHKPELDKYKITNEGHFIVYLANADVNRIIKVFTKFPEETFYVYGFNEDKQIDNITFKKTSRKEFLKDLTSAKAVIGNAGFSLTWEACLLNKLIWTIPYKGQYEQWVNSYRLCQLKRAYYSKNITLEDFQLFKTWLEDMDYKPQTKVTVLKADSILGEIYSYLDAYELTL